MWTQTLPKWFWVLKIAIKLIDLPKNERWGINKEKKLKLNKMKKVSKRTHHVDTALQIPPQRKAKQPQGPPGPPGPGGPQPGGGIFFSHFLEKMQRREMNLAW